ncbi:hypothetical protein BX600DRAFT_551241 [Xylariales sp. PMI_506]|nr:hypothetical protein BX600DRAFT_551241 [Xylariales sp. PMI_506]
MTLILHQIREEGSGLLIPKPNYIDLITVILSLVATACCCIFLSVYVVFIILFFIYRINSVENGICVIGVVRNIVIAPIALEIIINGYLTSLFLVPFFRLYRAWFRRNSVPLSLKSIRTLSLGFAQTTTSKRLKRLVVRSFVGSLLTLASTVTNLTVSMAYNGEPAWLCLLCCKSDIIFSVLVIHWVTVKDRSSSSSNKGASSNATMMTAPSEPPSAPKAVVAPVELADV